MRRSIERRLQVLEEATAPEAGALPVVVDDSTTDAEIEQLRAAGADVYRFGDFTEQCT